MNPYVCKQQVFNGHLYELVEASCFEVGLLCDGKGVRTWYANAFDGNMPDITHPCVQLAIETHDKYVINLMETMKHERATGTN